MKIKNSSCTLVYGYALKNAGDMAINLGSIELLSNYFDEINIISLFHHSNNHFKESRNYLLDHSKNIKVYSCPFIFDRNNNTFKRILNLLYNGLVLLGYKKKYLKNIIKSSELVIFNGGNLLRAINIKDYIRILGLIYPLKIARTLKKDYLIFPQSTSFIDNFGRLLLKKMLINANIVFLREKSSFNKINQIFSLRNSLSVIDSAFFIQSEQIKATNQENIIGITLRAQEIGDLKEFKEQKTNFIISQIRTITEDLIEKDFQIRIVCQTKKDLSISTKILHNLKEKYPLNVELIEEYDVRNLISLYSSFKLVFGMRLHSLILALNALTPVVGFFDESWGLKNKGTLMEFNMPVHFLNDDSQEIKLSIKKVLEKHNDHSKQIESIIKEYKIKIQNSIENQLK